MNCFQGLVCCVSACVLALSVSAGQVVVTEVWPGGLPGEESTADWVELTNVGATSFTDFGQLLFRTNGVSSAFPDGVPLSGATFEGVASLAPGESAVFLTDYHADAYDPASQTFYNAANVNEAINAFKTIWGSPVDGIQIGYLEATFGGPGDGLDQNGETIYIFQGLPFETGSAVLMQEVSYPASDRASWEFLSPGATAGQLSVLGVNGAFEGVLPANAQPGPIEGLPPIGSPGVFVPEPASLLCLASGMLLAPRRRLNDFR